MHGSINLNTVGVSVITCTKRTDSLKNILDNYNRQLKKKKELIIILHDNSMNLKKWYEAVKRYRDIKLYQIDQSVSLGECLNFGAANASFDIIAKFDDDDYYGDKYLHNTINVLNKIDADVIGKATSFVYFEKDKILAIRNVGHENCYVHHIDGSSIVFKRKVLEKVKFRDISCGEDKWFCKDCLEKGFKIYSTNRFQHVYMRHANIEDHTWCIANEKLLKWCRIVAIGGINYQKYINR